jgi:hypothetical protein
VSEEPVSLREYFEAHWVAHEKTHVALGDAIDKAAEDISRRLAEMNQFRAQISEERGLFLSKTEYEARHRELETRLGTVKDTQDKRLNDLERAKSNLDGRLWALGAGFMILTVLVNVAFRYWSK